MFREENVRRGMALLDERSPGWRQEIEVEFINVESPIDCPLGQVYNTYYNGLRELGLSVEESVACGFSLYDVVYDLQMYPIYAEQMNFTWKGLLRV